MCRSPLHVIWSDIPECFASAWNICTQHTSQMISIRPTARARQEAQRTWSRKPIPVETLISCLLPEPGWQSRLIATRISVSAVLRSIVAVRAAIFLNAVAEF